MEVGFTDSESVWDDSDSTEDSCTGSRRLCIGLSVAVLEVSGCGSTGLFASGRVCAKLGYGIGVGGTERERFRDNLSI